MNAPKTIAESIEEAIDSKIEKASRGGVKTVTATYVGKDADGKPYVQIPGSDSDTPVRRMSVQADINDVVTVTIENGMAVVDSNVSNPSASSSNLAKVETKAVKAQEQAEEVAQAVKSVKRQADTAIAQAASASEIASEAQAVAEATNQHFWDDSNGAHVTDVTQEEWTDAAESNFADLSTERPYHNSLFNSLGMLFRSALNNLVSITRSAIAFYDGLGNQSSNIVASFGSSGAQVGKASEAHVEITPTHMTFKYGDSQAIDMSSTNDSGVTASGHGRIILDNGAIGVSGTHNYDDTDTLSLYALGSRNGRDGMVEIEASSASGANSTILMQNDEVSIESAGSSRQSTLVMTETELYWCRDRDQEDQAFNFARNGNLTCGTVNGVDVEALEDKVAPIGTQVTEEFSTSVTVANASSATSGTGTAVGSITVTKGRWVIYGHWVFASNATGNRWGCINTSSGTVSPTATNPGSFRTAACSGAPTVVNAMTIVNVTGTTATYYLSAAQNSGAALGVTGCMRAIRII
ncbi:MAG: hypothetical protein J6S36_03655 [Eggerthellaceae bacterium]|nr:hypothetical protein [Eggerthellaceae bacterium]